MLFDDFKQKWITISDDTSPTGQTNQCGICGLRMSEYDPEDRNLIPELEPEEEIEMEWVNEGYLHDGAWWISKDIFFDLMKRGFGKKIQYSFVIEGQARLMPIDKLVVPECGHFICSSCSPQCTRCPICRDIGSADYALDDAFS